MKLAWVNIGVYIFYAQQSNLFGEILVDVLGFLELVGVVSFGEFLLLDVVVVLWVEVSEVHPVLFGIFGRAGGAVLELGGEELLGAALLFETLLLLVLLDGDHKIL